MNSIFDFVLELFQIFRNVIRSFVLILVLLLHVNLLSDHL